MERIVPVPQAARSLHAVFTADPIEPVADLAAPPASLLRRFGASDDDLTALSRRDQPHVFVLDAPLGTRLNTVAEQLADTRRAALAFADEHDGVVVDMLVPRIVGPTQTDPTVASHWVALDLDAGHLRSRGLEAFGLPELRAEAEDGARTGMILAVAMGLAQRLITEWPEHDPVGPAAVTLHDIALGFADPEPAPREPALDLMIDYTDGALVVTLVDDPTTLFG